MTSEEITIRMLRGEEREALVALSERDSATAPDGNVLGAFSGGELVAATSIDGGSTVADPFRPTDEVRSLLHGRAEQLRRAGGNHGRGRLARILGRRSRGALPSSPPGGGGRLLTLPPPPCR